MAYAVLVSLTRTVDEILNHDHYFISPQEKQMIISMDEYAILLQAFLEYFPEKGSSLEGRMRHIANEAEDLIEYFMWERRIRLIDWTFGLSRVKFKSKLEKVREKMDAIAQEVMEIKNSFRIVTQLDGSSAASSSSSATTKTNPVGFDDELTTIKYRLCGESSSREVIPIAGMGGIGKTTLARNAYEDPLIIEHFQIRAWITVSQDYSKQEIVSALLDCMIDQGFRGDIVGRSSEENLYKTLKCRRYLIVMDDMWSTEVWDDVKMIFPEDHNGSRIILTTRLLDVASYPDSFNLVHEMQFMDEVQSWNLLRWKAESTHDDPELEDIGREIARSCKGLPLAVVVIGGLLSTVSKTRASWEKIAENVNSAVGAKDGQFEKILSLRPCFLYMGCFPEDAKIRVSQLVRLWVAEGFVRSSQYRSLEEEAEEYLEDLVKRSLILVVDRRPNNGKTKSCSVHDLMRDLCIRKAEEDKFSLHSQNNVPKRIRRNQRRLCVDHDDLSCLASYGSSIRTVICFQCTPRSLAYLRNFRLLRVLHVVKSYSESSSRGAVRGHLMNYLV